MVLGKMSEISHLILDFDGTLVEGEPEGFRLSPLVRQISRLSSQGVAICLASGRGSAVLRFARFLWEKTSTKCYVIRWNGLEGLRVPPDEVLFRLRPFSREHLLRIRLLLKDMGFTPQILKPEIVRLKASSRSSPLAVLNKIRPTLGSHIPGILCTWNQAAVDISPPGCDKAAAVRKLFPHVKRSRVLALGDSCHELGNDYALLRSFPSYCVGNWDAACSAGRAVINAEGRVLHGTTATFHVLRDVSGAKEKSFSVSVIKT